MKKTTIVLTLRWPNKSDGVKMSEVLTRLDSFDKHFRTNDKTVYKLSGGKTLKIERKQAKKSTKSHKKRGFDAKKVKIRKVLSFQGEEYDFGV